MKGSILRLPVPKVDSYRNEKDLTPTLYNTVRVIPDNNEKYIVIDNDVNIAREYVHETTIMYPHHLYNTKTKMKPTTGLNKNNKTLLYSSIRYDSSLSQTNIMITHENPNTITDNYEHVQIECKYLPLQNFSE